MNNNYHYRLALPLTFKFFKAWVMQVRLKNEISWPNSLFSNECNSDEEVLNHYSQTWLFSYKFTHTIASPFGSYIYIGSKRATINSLIGPIYIMLSFMLDSWGCYHYIVRLHLWVGPLLHVIFIGRDHPPIHALLGCHPLLGRFDRLSQFPLLTGSLVLGMDLEGLIMRAESIIRVGYYQYSPPLPPSRKVLN